MSNFYKPAYDPTLASPLEKCAGSDYCTLSTIGDEDPAVTARLCRLAASAILEETGEVSSCPQTVTVELIRQQQHSEDALDGVTYA